MLGGGEGRKGGVPQVASSRAKRGGEGGGVLLAEIVPKSGELATTSTATSESFGGETRRGEARSGMMQE